MYSILRYIYFASVFTFYAALHFNYTTFQRQILYFLLHYVFDSYNNHFVVYYLIYKIYNFIEYRWNYPLLKSCLNINAW